MDFYSLATNTPDIIEKINKAEAEGRFNDHLDPVSTEGCLPVDESFPYLPGFFTNIKYWFFRNIVLRPFSKSVNKKYFHTKVVGRENLRGIKNAVFICNHVNKYDGLAFDYAIGFRKCKIMVAEFNNREGMLGTLMRADGILPFKPQGACIKQFTKAVNYYLTHKVPVLFFPEGSEWFCYKKPRPFANGAFHYAATNNVPVVPMFITFSLSPDEATKGFELIDDAICCKKSPNGILYPPNFTVHILPPVYPDPTKTRSQNIEEMKQLSYAAWCKVFESAYKN